MTPEELKLAAVGTETMNVVHRFAPKELDERRKMVTDLSVELMYADEGWEELKAQHNQKVKPIKDALSNTIKEVGRGFEEKQELVYLIPDQESGMMSYVTADGVVAHVRPLLPAERQMSIISHMKEGTHDVR